MRRMGGTLETILIAVAVALLVAGCASENATDSSSATGPPPPAAGTRALTMDDWPAVVATPDAFVGREVRGIVGRVLVVEDLGAGLEVQMLTSSDFSDGNTIVKIPAKDAPTAVTEGDHLRVDGIAQGSFTGENATGSQITTPIVQAGAARRIDAAEALVAADRALASKQLRVSQVHGGLVVTITRVDRLDDGARIEVRARNGGAAPVTLSTLEATVLQGSRQLVAKPSFDLPGLPTAMQPGFGGTALLTFPGLRAGPARLLIEWFSDDYNLDTPPFSLVFRVP